ncbi:putative asparagine--tRNA ligase, mitochondrial [Colletotrichum liriopes]|uniref:Asparagine--tRNA ligase, mitochondrial n=1 Tax=Colletotrichum liriopes TaxID=708192 RepID=A0AA37LXP5_9PEZI|nr:putative asparagine--tRNA ligase, mitochondrial [Colletotrichum liriopes]
MSPRRLGRSLLSTQPLGRRQLSTVTRKTVAQFLDWKPETEVKDVVLNGYVRSVRNMKTERFVNVGDGSSRTPIQALVSRSHDESPPTGSWVPSKTEGQSHELKVEDVEVLGPSDAKASLLNHSCSPTTF